MGEVKRYYLYKLSSIDWFFLKAYTEEEALNQVKYFYPGHLNDDDIDKEYLEEIDISRGFNVYLNSEDYKFIGHQAIL